MKTLKTLNRFLILFMGLPLLVYYFFPEKPIPEGPPIYAIATTIHNTDIGMYSFLFVVWCWWSIGFFWLYFRVIVKNYPEKLALVRKFAALSIVLSCVWLICGALGIIFNVFSCEPSLVCFLPGLIIGLVLAASYYFSYFTYVIFFILASRNLYGSYFLAPLLWLFLPLVALFEEYLRPYLRSAKA